jgi:BA14K-like protein
MPTWKILSIGCLALGLGMGQAQAAPAAPAPSVATAGADSGVVHVRRGWGPGLGIGLGLGLFTGAVIANETYRPRPGYYYDDYGYDGPYYAPAGYGGDPRELCAQNFRSFEWDTGRYTTYSGERRVCPYLR